MAGEADLNHPDKKARSCTGVSLAHVKFFSLSRSRVPLTKISRNTSGGKLLIFHIPTTLSRSRSETSGFLQIIEYWVYPEGGEVPKVEDLETEQEGERDEDHRSGPKLAMEDYTTQRYRSHKNCWGHDSFGCYSQTYRPAVGTNIAQLGPFPPGPTLAQPLPNVTKTCRHWQRWGCVSQDGIVKQRALFSFGFSGFLFVFSRGANGAGVPPFSWVNVQDSRTIWSIYSRASWGGEFPTHTVGKWLQESNPPSTPNNRRVVSNYNYVRLCIHRI